MKEAAGAELPLPLKGRQRSEGFVLEKLEMLSL